MAVTYKVNTTTITAGIQAEWQPIQTETRGGGKPAYSDWQRHIWRMSELDHATYDTLKALRGTALTSVDTTEHDALNTQETYSDVRLMTVSGRQQGIRVLNVQVEFLIDTTSGA